MWGSLAPDLLQGRTKCVQGNYHFTKLEFKWNLFRNKKKRGFLFRKLVYLKRIYTQRGNQGHFQSEDAINRLIVLSADPEITCLLSHDNARLLLLSPSMINHQQTIINSILKPVTMAAATSSLHLFWKAYYFSRFNTNVIQETKIHSKQKYWSSIN